MAGGDIAVRARLYGWARLTLVVMALCLVPLAIIPELSAMYRIIAVEFGDHVIESEVGQKAMRVLEQKLDEALDP